MRSTGPTSTSSPKSPLVLPADVCIESPSLSSGILLPVMPSLSPTPSPFFPLAPHQPTNLPESFIITFFKKPISFLCVLTSLAHLSFPLSPLPQEQYIWPCLSLILLLHFYPCHYAGPGDHSWLSDHLRTQPHSPAFFLGRRGCPCPGLLLLLGLPLSPSPLLLTHHIWL